MNALRPFAKICLLLTACFALTSCDEAQPDTAEKTHFAEQTDPNTLTRALYANQFVLDPHFAQNSAESAPLRDLFVGLTRFNSKGEIVPAIAQQWFTEDGKEWLFMLDEWAKWSNDAPVTAQDFVASWQRLAAPQTHSPLAPYLIYMGVKNAKAVEAGQLPVAALGVEALNPHSLKIVLDQPNFVLPKMLAHIALLPSYQGVKPELNQTLITNGDYQLKAATSETLSLQAVNAEPFFAAVQYQRLTPEQPEATVDLVENPPENGQQPLFALPRNCIYAYELNLADPILQQKNVRKVLKALASTMTTPARFGIVTDSILPVAMQDRSESHWQPVIIEQLLSQAGITPQHPLNLTLAYDNHGQHPAIANAMLRTFGQSDLIKIQPQPLSWQALLQQRAARQFQLSRAGWCADYPDPVEFVRHFHSQSPDNKTGYHNETVDRLIEQLLSKNLSETDRLHLAQQAAQQIKEDIAVLPLFQYQRKIALNSAIRGIEQTNASEVIYSKDLFRIPSSEDNNEPTERPTTR